MVVPRVAEFFSVFVVVLSLVWSANIQNDEEKFIKFMKKFQKPYQYGSKEYKQRFQTFKENLRIQENLNQKRPNNSSAVYGITKFSDLSQDEFQDKYLSAYTPSKEAFHSLQAASPWYNNQVQLDLPKRVDWYDSQLGIEQFDYLKPEKRKKSCVTPVRNQKSCGACWAFSIVEAMESRACIQSGQKPSLSIQEVIDCSYGYGVLGGCAGGDICTALRWLLDSNRELVPQSEYPLTDELGTCKSAFNHSKGVGVKAYTCQKLVGSETSLLDSLAHHGPVAVAIDATTWNNYLGGIIQFHCGSRPNNHAVEIVGYDLTGEIPYYIIKNSWGPDFGIDGYLYVAVGGNLCGLAQEVATVDVTV